MVLELHIWGPAFSLPSIDPQCLATVVYVRQILSNHEWVLIASSDDTLSPTSESDSPPALAHYSTHVGISIPSNLQIANLSGTCQRHYLPSEMDQRGLVAFETSLIT